MGYMQAVGYSNLEHGLPELQAFQPIFLGYHNTIVFSVYAK